MSSLKVTFFFWSSEGDSPRHQLCEKVLLIFLEGSIIPFPDISILGHYSLEAQASSLMSIGKRIFQLTHQQMLVTLFLIRKFAQISDSSIWLFLKFYASLPIVTTGTTWKEHNNSWYFKLFILEPHRNKQKLNFRNQLKLVCHVVNLWKQNLTQNLEHLEGKKITKKKVSLPCIQKKNKNKKVSLSIQSNRTAFDYF